ncbi:hypothetical protein N8T08_004375 [Aspergillus melleus]|uniref:Uncharacterized protein n=1 Tax=Aspergillus melleus TaxID=138277 RepID=A0ACC3B475_9EURO|nr:hypothetical protein N8T08_004375 [Aspergillus melleus]
MKFRLPLKPDEVPVTEKEVRHDNEAVPVPNSKEAQVSDPAVGSDSESELVNPNFQHGVQAAQAMTQVWSMQHIVLAYALIWIIHFVMAFASSIIGTLTPYVTSSFKQHSLTATTQILSSLMGGLMKLPYAKLMDIWGRPQGFAVMLGSLTVGLIMMAGCNNVETYCAAQVFHSIGTSGMNFTMDIFIADTSALRNRAFWFAFIASPYIATTWAYGPAAESVLKTMGFRWGFGMWAIILPFVCSPLFFLFYYNQRKAIKAGLVPERNSNRTWWESVVYYLKEFDALGLLLLVAGIALFLLSFNLYTKQADGWRSPLIICFVTIGGLLIIAFALYERFWAPVTFIPWKLMKNPTVFFTYTMAASIYTAWYMWDNYFYSLLIVVMNQSVTHATYITNIYTVGSCFWSLVMGVLIRYNGRLKWTALYFGVPITILGVGLMIKFREADTNIGYIVMCQIFIAFGGGTLVICEQMTVMAVSTQQDIPAVLAIEGAVISIGSAVGSTIAGAMWMGIFPEKLMKYLPASELDNFANIYGDLTVQAGYPIGSDARNAINRSYSETQRLMLIAATCLYIFTLGSVIMWKDVNVKKINQVKGRIL